jgi:hypothetical protein
VRDGCDGDWRVHRSDQRQFRSTVGVAGWGEGQYFNKCENTVLPTESTLYFKVVRVSYPYIPKIEQFPGCRSNKQQN